MILNTAFQRRLMVEDFTRLRRADELRRFAASQRRGRVDANPHQIDAVAFALERIPEGGCILADEVGLGKTIEAGLIVAQLMAEGMTRVLLVVPKALMGQWQSELRSLFGFEVAIGEMNPDAFIGEGIFIVNREFAGGARGAPLLSSSEPFDLAIIDEAHELFAGIYKRFDKNGIYQDDAKHAQTAHRVRDLLKERDTPVLLLTATPMQNNLEELWGLVHYTERTDQLLGALPVYRDMFALPSRNEEGLADELAFDLRTRLKTVIQRSLRRQAQEFLEIPFVERHAKTVEYQLSTEERQLYNDITTWLMRPDLLSYATNTRRLLVIGFHRRMASSFAALRASLSNVAARLRAELEDGASNAWDQTIAEFASDLEELVEDSDYLDEDDDDQHNPRVTDDDDQYRDPAKIADELALLEEFIQRAEQLQDDSKSQCLLTTLEVIRDREATGEGTGKAVIFTESLETQNYLYDYLVRHGYEPTAITLFRGTNKHARATEALNNWETEVASSLPPSHVPPPDIAVRVALVHEFKTRSRIFISTEAGAKGLNLQFCESLINYDLPWNPQRIEQRIGRVHRYGQRRGVFVFNLIDLGNEAANLTYEILSRKLDLFGKVLDASDDILHTPDHDFPESLVSDIGVDFERQIRQVYQQSTSIEDVIAQLRTMRESIDNRRNEFDQTQQRCAEVIESRLDDSVANIFKNYSSELPACLAQLDRETDTIVHSYLTAINCEHSRIEENDLIRYQLSPCQKLPREHSNGGSFLIGDPNEINAGEALYQDHRLLKAAFSEAQAPDQLTCCVKLSCSTGPLASYIGQRGRLRLTKVKYRGLVKVDHLIIIMVVDGTEDPIEGIDVSTLLSLHTESCADFQSSIDTSLMEECLEEAVFDDQRAIGDQEHDIFTSRMQQLERYLQDRKLVIDQLLQVLNRELADLHRKRESSSSPTSLSKINDSARKVSNDISRLENQLDQLHNNNEPNYQTWKNNLLALRKLQPERSTAIDAQFEIIRE